MTNFSITPAAAKAAEAEAKQKEVEAKAAAVAKAKEEKLAAEKAAKEAERIADEKAKQKKKPIRYSTEDLDIRLSKRNKKAGMKLTHPLPSRGPNKMPFNKTRGMFEQLLATWNFLVCFGCVIPLFVFVLGVPNCSTGNNCIYHHLL